MPYPQTNTSIALRMVGLLFYFLLLTFFFFFWEKGTDEEEGKNMGMT